MTRVTWKRMGRERWGGNCTGIRMGRRGGEEGKEGECVGSVWGREERGMDSVEGSVTMWRGSNGEKIRRVKKIKSEEKSD